MAKEISIFSKSDSRSTRTKKRLAEILKQNGFSVKDDSQNPGDLIVCIGGDGTFLKTIHHFDFPCTPVIGINTGHLGFFQEISPEELDQFVQLYKAGRYNIQPYKGIQGKIFAEGRQHDIQGMNEIVIRGERSIHLNVSIGNSFIQKFSGDGILLCTPAGSTAYNYSLGGSIVDPSLDVLQITPIAPMNTSAYRSFTSSVIVPEGKLITVEPEKGSSKAVLVITDGRTSKYKAIDKIQVKLSDKTVHLLRLENYDFWDKVKVKLLDSSGEGLTECLNDRNKRKKT